MNVLEQLENLLRPIVEGQGHELLEIKLHGKSSKIIRVAIYNPRKLTLDQISKVSKMLSAELDVHDIINSKYYLEVSSPGLDRPLKTLHDFKRTLGEQVTIWDNEGKTYFGELRGVKGKQVFLETDANEMLEFDITKINHGRIKTKY